MPRRARWLASLPERLARAAVAVVGGGVHETAQLVLPRLVRNSRLYEATAKNMLRVMVELVGGVETRQAEGEYEPNVGKLAVRKTAGNAVELGSIFAFGFSPLWVLAATADVTKGARTYLDVLTRELQAEGVLSPDATVASIDELLAALEGGSGTVARLIDIPPLEVAALRRTLDDLREDSRGLPGPDEMHAVLATLRDVASRERRSVLEVSAGIGLAFFNASRHVGRQHVLDAYAEDLRPLRNEGFGGYASRVSEPYGRAVARLWDPETRTLTDRAIEKVTARTKPTGSGPRS